MKILKRKMIIVLIIISILIYFIRFIPRKYLQDDLIFFKIFNQEKQQNSKKTNKYKIKVSKDINYKTINLVQTIDLKNLINKKIFPGASGDFEIILTSNSKMKYKIAFRSINEKPENLEFYLENDFRKYRTLEELQEILNGVIEKGENKKTKICWEWKYENNIEGNLRDTKDGEKIKTYNFEIFTIGE